MNLPCWAVKASVCLHAQIYCAKDVFYTEYCRTIRRDIISSEPSQERMQSLRSCLNVLLPLSVIGNFTTFQWRLPESGPMEYLLGVLGESTVIEAT